MHGRKFRVFDKLDPVPAKIATTHSKFFWEKDPIEKEPGLKEITPLPHRYNEIKQRYYKQKRDDIAATTDPTTRAAMMNALEFTEFADFESKVKNSINEGFLLGFVNWCLGNGSDVDVKRTSFGRYNLARDSPEIRAYIIGPIEKRNKYIDKLVKMVHFEQAPKTLLDAYMYYKFVVQGHDLTSDEIDYLDLLDHPGDGPTSDPSDDGNDDGFEGFSGTESGPENPNLKPRARPRADINNNNYRPETVEDNNLDQYKPGAPEALKPGSTGAEPPPEIIHDKVVNELPKDSPKVDPVALTAQGPVAMEIDPQEKKDKAVEEVPNQPPPKPKPAPAPAPEIQASVDALEASNRELKKVIDETKEAAKNINPGPPPDAPKVSAVDKDLTTLRSEAQELIDKVDKMTKDSEKSAKESEERLRALHLNDKRPEDVETVKSSGPKVPPEDKPKVAVPVVPATVEPVKKLSEEAQKENEKILEVMRSNNRAEMDETKRLIADKVNRFYKIKKTDETRHSTAFSHGKDMTPFLKLFNTPSDKTGIPMAWIRMRDVLGMELNPLIIDWDDHGNNDTDAYLEIVTSLSGSPERGINFWGWQVRGKEDGFGDKFGKKKADLLKSQGIPGQTYVRNIGTSAPPFVPGPFTMKTEYGRKVMSKFFAKDAIDPKKAEKEMVDMFNSALYRGERGSIIAEQGTVTQDEWDKYLSENFTPEQLKVVPIDQGPSLLNKHASPNNKKQEVPVQKKVTIQEPIKPEPQKAQAVQAKQQTEQKTAPVQQPVVPVPAPQAPVQAQPQPQPQVQAQPPAKVPSPAPAPVAPQAAVQAPVAPAPAPKTATVPVPDRPVPAPNPAPATAPTDVKTEKEQQLVTEMNKLHEKIVKADKEKAVLEKALKGKDNAIGQREVAITKLMGRGAQLQKALSTATSENKELKETLKAKDVVMQNNEKQFDEYIRQFNAKDFDNKVLESKLKQSQQEAVKNITDKMDTSESLPEKHLLSAVTTDDIISRRVQITDEALAFIAQNSDATTEQKLKILKLEAMVEEKTKAIEESEAKVASITKEGQAARDAQHEATQALIKKLDSDIRKNVSDEMRLEFSKVEFQMQTSLLAKQQQIDHLNNTVNEITQFNQQVTTERNEALNQLRSEQTTSLNQRAHMETMINLGVTQELKRLETERPDVGIVMQDMQRQYEQKMIDLENVFKGKQNEFMKYSAELENSLVTVQSSLESVRSDYQELKDNYKTDDLVKRLETSKKDYFRLSETLEQTKEWLGTAEAERETAKQQLVKLTSELKKLRTSREQEVTSEVAAAVAEKQKEIEAMAQTIDRMSSEAPRVEYIIQKIEQRVDNVHTITQKLKRKYDEKVIQEEAEAAEAEEQEEAPVEEPPSNKRRSILFGGMPKRIDTRPAVQRPLIRTFNSPRQMPIPQFRPEPPQFDYKSQHYTSARREDVGSAAEKRSELSASIQEEAAAMMASKDPNVIAEGESLAEQLAEINNGQSESRAQEQESVVPEQEVAPAVEEIQQPRLRERGKGGSNKADRIKDPYKRAIYQNALRREIGTREQKQMLKRRDSVFKEKPYERRFTGQQELDELAIQDMESLLANAGSFRDSSGYVPYRRRNKY